MGCIVLQFMVCETMHALLGNVYGLQEYMEYWHKLECRNT